MDDVLVVENLKIWYRTGGKIVRAVNGVNLRIKRGEMLGLVGESGSGKSTLAHAVMRLLPENARIESGKIELFGVNVLELGEEELRRMRWKRFSMVFQRSMSGLSPVHRVGDQLSDAYLIHHPSSSKGDALNRIREVFDLVNLPERVIRSYPHELSGGMRQRVMIALALINSPEFVVFDEATTALDVVTQGQIVDEIKRLVRDLSLTGMVITHDMGIVAELCDRIAVMYAGKIVEVGTKDEILLSPLHPYTRALVSSIPDLLGEGERLRGIPGTLPDLTVGIEGCVFADRCPIAGEECHGVEPPRRVFGTREVYCHKVGEAS